MIIGTVHQTSGGRGLLAHLLHRMHLDPMLLTGLLAVMSMGTLVLYSASGNDLDILLRQATRIGAAMLVLVFMAQINIAWIRRAAPWAYLIGLVTLVLVIVTGETGGGAQRWLNIGIRFQPSELMKLAVPAMLAWFLHERPLPPTRRWWMSVTRRQQIEPRMPAP